MTRPLVKRPEVAGFGLLEAIVALTLLAGTGLALFSWIQQNLATATRVQTAQQEARLQLNALAVVDALNPATATSGHEELAQLEVRWSATLAERPRPNAAMAPGASGSWKLGLYRIEVLARDPRSGLQRQFTAYRVGQSPSQAAEAPLSESRP